MQKSQKINMNEELLRFLQQESSADNSMIKKLFTLETFGQCISDQQFSVPSKLKLKMLKAFKYLVLESFSLFNQNNDQAKKRDIIQTQKLTCAFYQKVSSYLTIFTERKLVFLPNQEQWKEFIQIILKLVFGLDYQLNLPLKTKQKLLIDCAQSLNRRNNKIKNLGLGFFIEQLQSSSLLRQLLNSCSNSDNIHILFELCFVILVQQQNRSQQNIENDLNIVPDILEKIFMQEKFAQEYVQFYSNLLGYLRNSIQSQSPSFARLTFRMQTQFLIQKINGTKENPDEKPFNSKEIQKIKQNLKLFLTQKFHRICQTDEFSLQKPQQMKLLQTSLIAAFLMGENYIENLSWISQIDIEEKLLLKIIQTLKISYCLNKPQDLFTFCKQNLSFINQTIRKLKQNPSKGLKFIDHQSSFSASISSECEVNFKIKAFKSKETLVLFQLVSKNKRIEIVQKIVDSKFMKIGCLQYAKHEIKSKQVQQHFDFQPTQQFTLYFEKSKVKLHLIKKVNETTQNLKLLEIQKFQSIGSKINIGMIQGIIKEAKNVEEIQKFIVLSQSMKKDKTQLIEKTNVFKIAVQMLERNGQNVKNSDTKMYGFKMNNLSVKNYHNNFGLFAQKNNIKPIVIKALKELVDRFFQIQIKCQQKISQNPNIESDMYNDFNSSIKEIVHLLKSSEEQKSFIFEDILQIVIECFLSKCDFVYQNDQTGHNLLKKALDIIKLISTQASSINVPNKTQLLTSKFLTSIMNCSISIYLSSIEIFQEKYLSESQQTNKHTLQLFRTIIFHAVLLISDPKVLKQEKTLIIEKIQVLLGKVHENLSHKKLKYDQINEVEQTLRFIIGILKNDKYENESHEKMRRFKLSYLLIKFLKESFNLLKFNAEMVQNLLTSSQNLCTTKIQHLRLLIQKDEDESNTKSSNETVTTSADIKNFPSNDQVQKIQQQMSQQTIVLSVKQSQIKLINQSLKDKIYLLSAYVDLFYTTKNFGRNEIEMLLSSLEEILKQIKDKENLTQSAFQSQLLNKSWINFIKIFESTFDHNQPQVSYLKSQIILQKLISYGFQNLSDPIVIKIVQTLLFHPVLFFTNFDIQIFYQRLHELGDQILKVVQNLYKKFTKIDQPTWINIQKSLILLFLKTQNSVNSLMELQMYEFPQNQEGNFYFKALQNYINLQILKYLVTQKSQKDAKIKQLQSKVLKTNSFIIKILKQQKALLKNSELQNVYQQIISFQKQLENGSVIVSEESFLNSLILSYKGFLSNHIKTLKHQFKTSLAIKISQINLLKERKQKAQKLVDNKKQIKGILKRQISAKQLNLKINNKKELKVQTGKDEEIFRSQQPRSTLSQINRKIGKNITEQKILLNHIQNLATNILFIESSLSKNSNQANNSFQDEKIYLTQKNLLQFNKKSTDVQYSIDDYCDKNGMKTLICKENVSKRLPKIQEIKNHQQKVTKNSFKNTIENLKMVKASAEIYSAKLMQKVSDSKNFSKKIHETIPTSPTFKVKIKQIGHYVDAFQVTLITNSMFYQGELKVYNYNLCDFVESKEVDLQNYQQLAALESQQRKKNQILKNPISFQIKFDINGAQYIKRKYLKVDNSIQIFTKNRSYFFVFKNQKQRDNFTAKIYQKAQLNHDKIYKFTKLWQKGVMTNFEYLMQVNKFADRSFNDISQYYVFPWTIIDNKSQNFDDEFIKDLKNYRDLTKPIGKINKGKFGKIKQQYQNSKKYANSNRPLFLYSSFYSNPAIVSYYLIRLQPFSAHQYELQSGKFDQSDRLFGSIQGNYSAVYNIPGDFKELIPQFYYSPYFLKNLNQYNFGMTQKNVMIDDVELPQWVRTKTPQQFVFKMRKCLQSSFVTQNLHKWIDLTFGMCAQKSKAEKYQNLYNENVYGQNLQNQNSAFINKSLKQFGEIPRIIFQTQHPANLMKTYDKHRMLKKSKSLADIFKQQLLKQEIKQYSHNECEKLDDETESNLIKFNRKNAEKQEKDKNLSKQSMASMKSIKIFDDENEQADQTSFMMIRQNCLIAKHAYGFGYYNFSEDNKDPFDYKNRPQLSTISKCDLLTVQDGKNPESYLLSIENFKLFGHKFNSKSMRGWKNSIGDKFQIQTEQQFKLLKTIGSYLILVNQYDEVKIFTTQSSLKNKKAKINETLKIENSTIFHAKTIKLDSYQITDIQVNEYLSIMSLKVGQNQFVVFDVRDDNKIDLRLKLSVDLMFEEKILKVQIHNMGYILIFTNKNRFVLFNLLGEMIVNIMICFDKQVKMSKQESISSACFWSQQSSNLLFSTNLGILYKADIFDIVQKRSKNQNYLSNEINLPIDEFEIFKENNEDLFESIKLKGLQKIVDMKMQRRGRHWKVYCLGRRGNIYTLKNKYFDMAK